MKTAKYFDDDIAKDLGTDAAIILHNIELWQENNGTANEGRNWVPITLEEFIVLFPYLTISKIRTCLNRLKVSGYILVSNFNKTKYDRTTWYTALKPEI